MNKRIFLIHLISKLNVFSLLLSLLRLYCRPNKSFILVLIGFVSLTSCHSKLYFDEDLENRWTPVTFYLKNGLPVYYNATGLPEVANQMQIALKIDLDSRVINQFKSYDPLNLFIACLFNEDKEKKYLTELEHLYRAERQVYIGTRCIVMRFKLSARYGKEAVQKLALWLDEFHFNQSLLKDKLNWMIKKNTQREKIIDPRILKDVLGYGMSDLEIKKASDIPKELTHHFNAVINAENVSLYIESNEPFESIETALEVSFGQYSPGISTQTSPHTDQKNTDVRIKLDKTIPVRDKYLLATKSNLLSEFVLGEYLKLKHLKKVQGEFDSISNQNIKWGTHLVLFLNQKEYEEYHLILKREVSSDFKENWKAFINKKLLNYKNELFLGDEYLLGHLSEIKKLINLWNQEQVEGLLEEFISLDQVLIELKHHSSSTNAYKKPPKRHRINNLNIIIDKARDASLSFYMGELDFFDKRVIVFLNEMTKAITDTFPNVTAEITPFKYTMKGEGVGSTLFCKELLGFIQNHSSTEKEVTAKRWFLKEAYVFKKEKLHYHAVRKEIFTSILKHTSEGHLLFNNYLSLENNNNQRDVTNKAYSNNSTYNNTYSTDIGHYFLKNGLIQLITSSQEVTEIAKDKELKKILNSKSGLDFKPKENIVPNFVTLSNNSDLLHKKSLYVFSFPTHSLDDVFNPGLIIGYLFFSGGFIHPTYKVFEGGQYRIVNTGYRKLKSIDFNLQVAKKKIHYFISLEHGSRYGQEKTINILNHLIYDRINHLKNVNVSSEEFKRVISQTLSFYDLQLSNVDIFPLDNITQSDLSEIDYFKDAIANYGQRKILTIANHYFNEQTCLNFSVKGKIYPLVEVY